MLSTIMLWENVFLSNPKAVVKWKLLTLCKHKQRLLRNIKSCLLKLENMCGRNIETLESFDGIKHLSGLLYVFYFNK